MEASIEHMSRGTVRHIDTLLIVLEPYYRSLEAGGRLFRLATEMSIKQVFGVANKVRSDQEESAIRHYCEEKKLSLLGVIPYDEGVGKADSEAKAVIDAYPETPAVKAIERLVTEMLA